VNAYRIAVEEGQPQLQLIWASTLENAYSTSSPVVANGVVFVVGAGSATAYDAVTGEIRWQQDGISLSGGRGGPVVANGRFYVIADSGLHAFALDEIFHDGLDPATAPIP
jgi:outer membrane protein assembly factor BamB